MKSRPLSGISASQSIVLCLAFSTLPSWAAVIGEDTFDYPNAAVAGLAGGTGWNYQRTVEAGAAAQLPSDWDNVTATPQVVGGALKTSASSAKREFGGATEGSAAGSNEREGAFRGEGTAYFAVDFSVDTMLAAATSQWGGMSSYDFGTERIFFGMPGQAAAVRYFGVDGSAGRALSTIPVEAGIVYRLVGCVDFQNDKVKLWVNPDASDFDDGAVSSADASANYTGTNWSSALRLGSGAGYTATWDNVKVADTLSDLLPPPSGVTVSRVILSSQSFSAKLTDAAGAVFDPAKPVTVTVDGTPVTTAVSKEGDTGTLSFQFTGANVFTNGAHTVVITARDTTNRVISSTTQVTTQPYTMLSADWKPAAGVVDMTKPGFRATVNQLPFLRYPVGVDNNLPQPERQLGLGFTSPRGGAPVENLITPGPENGGAYLVESGIDWEIGSTHGAFVGAAVPGISDSSNNVVAEFTAWLQLPAGSTQLGVNCDDGFLASSGANPLDVLRGERLSAFDGGRAAADTLFEVVAPVAGLYPVRLLWWQGGGDGSLEFFSVNPDGTKILIGDPSSPDAIKAYWSGRAAIPSLHTIAPFPNSTENGKLQPIRIELLDGVTALKDSSVTLTVDGATVTPLLTRPYAGTAVISLNPPGGAWAALSSHTATLTYEDMAGASRTETWTFTVATDPTVIVGTEQFDYPDGAIADLAGGAGWDYLRTPEAHAQAQAPSDWDNVSGTPAVSGGLLLTSGSSAKREFGGAVEGSAAGSNEREGSFRGSGVVFVGVDYKIDSLLAEGTNQWSGFSSYDFGTERLFFGIPGQTTAERYFGIGGAATGLTSIPVETGVTYRLVAAVDFDVDLVKLWVNPDDQDYDNGTDNSADITAAYTGTNWSSAVRLGSGTGFTTSWDNLAVAQQLSDVLGSVPAVTGPLELLSYSINRAAGTVDLTWSSTAAQTYDVEYSRDLSTWKPLAESLAAGAGSSTTWHGVLSAIPNAPTPSAETRLFFRARTAD